MKNIFEIVMVIIGSIIGAGFASGQEINSFFYKYGRSGIIGMIVSISIISFIIYKVFKIVKSKQVKTYNGFLEELLRTKKNKYINLSYIMNIIINTFLIISFFIMIAGFGAYFKQVYGLNQQVGSLILSCICFIIFLKDVEGLVKVNKYLIPILIIFMVIIGFMNVQNISLVKRYDIKLESTLSQAIISGVIYASYNIILLVPTLIALKDKITKKENVKLISIISGIILFILALIIYFLLDNIKVDIGTIELPAVYSVSKQFPYLSGVYGFIILASILTTAIALGVSFLENVCKSKKSYTQVASILCITSVIFSKIGFSNLINLLYPVFGVLGLMQILMLILKR